MDIIARAKQLADQLDAHPHARAYHDPAKALANRPCLLVTPPVLDWTAGAFGGVPQTEWRIVALASHSAGTLDAVQELSKLITAADDVLGLERATPARYTLTKGDPVPCYVCIHTEIQ